MEDKNLRSLHINIAGKLYPLKVTEEEAQIAQKIEKELNHKISEFQLKFRDIDKLDSLVMVLISDAFEKHKKQSNLNNKVARKLEILEQLVEANLS